MIWAVMPQLSLIHISTNFFMSIGMAGKAIFLSLSRQLLFLMRL